MSLQGEELGEVMEVRVGLRWSELRDEVRV